MTAWAGCFRTESRASVIAIIGLAGGWLGWHELRDSLLLPGMW